jgi:hypothetical protein
MNKNIPVNKNLTKQKKITLATIKSFIRKNEGNIFIYAKSTFDGMVDCVMPTGNKEFVPAKKTDSHIQYTFGIEDAWFVGRSADMFRPYEDSKYIGYNIYNCCGEFNLAIKKSSF